MAVRLCPGVHVVKIILSGFIVFFLGALCVAGLTFQKNKIPTPPLKLGDQCPNEKRDPITKSPAQITVVKRDNHVLHEKFGFQFDIPDLGFRYEENTLQDYEEPIALPLYLYTMYLTYPGTREISRAAPVEMKFLIYPTLCNTLDDWVSFLESQGWSRIQDEEVKYRSFVAVGKQQSGRSFIRYFRHVGVWHYEFDLSWDNVSPDAEEGLRKADAILESFRLLHEKEQL